MGSSSAHNWIRRTACLTSGSEGGSPLGSTIHVETAGSYWLHLIYVLSSSDTFRSRVRTRNCVCDVIRDEPKISNVTSNVSFHVDPATVHQPSGSGTTETCGVGVAVSEPSSGVGLANDEPSSGVALAAAGITVGCAVAVAEAAGSTVPSEGAKHPPTRIAGTTRAMRTHRALEKLPIHQVCRTHTQSRIATPLIPAFAGIHLSLPFSKAKATKL